MDQHDEWADILLERFKAVDRCDIDDDLTDNDDPDAVEQAAQEAYRHPPEGMTAKQAAKYVKQRIDEIPYECSHLIMMGAD